MDKGEIILYHTQEGESKIEVRLANETVWLTADQMAELFQRNKSTISRHIRNVYESGKLTQDRTVAFFATVQDEGGRNVERNIAFYKLDMIISVEYRVNSYRGVQFRIWASQVLKEYMIKGFAHNDELLKNAGQRNFSRMPGCYRQKWRKKKRIWSMSDSGNAQRNNFRQLKSTLSNRLRQSERN